MSETRSQRPLLILDLDECLIYGAENELFRAADLRVGPYHVYYRPQLQKFLARVPQWYELAIWSSGTSDYVSAIAEAIRPPNVRWVFVWGRDRCTPRLDPESLETVYLKNLKKIKSIGFPKERTLVVDDTPTKLARNFGNAIYVQPFEGTRKMPSCRSC